MATAVTRTVVTSTSGDGGTTCVWNWSYFFSVMDVVVGGLVTAQGLVLVFTAYATFRMVVIGCLATVLGINVLVSSLMACESMYNSTRFYWSWLGRGIFFIILGCIAGDDPHRVLGFVAFLVCVTLGFVYVFLQFCSGCCIGLPLGPRPLCGATFIMSSAPPPAAPAGSRGGARTGEPKTNVKNPFGGMEGASECIA